MNTLIPEKGQGWLDGPAGGIVNADLSQVKGEAREAAIHFVNQIAEHVRNRQKRMIGCSDGHVLLVTFDVCWGYHIAGEGRSYDNAGGCWSGSSYEDCLSLARKHANDSFGGIRWENSL